MNRLEDQFKLAQGVWTDSWMFYKKYHGKPAEPEMWDEVINDFGKITKKYNRETLCIRVMLAALSLLEEETR